MVAGSSPVVLADFTSRKCFRTGHLRLLRWWAREIDFRTLPDHFTGFHKPVPCPLGRMAGRETSEARQPWRASLVSFTPCRPSARFLAVRLTQASQPGRQFRHPRPVPRVLRGIDLPLQPGAVALRVTVPGDDLGRETGENPAERPVALQPQLRTDVVPVSTLTSNYLFRGVDAVRRLE